MEPIEFMLFKIKFTAVIAGNNDGKREIVWNFNHDEEDAPEFHFCIFCLL